MKSRYTLWSLMILCLPVVAVWWLWDDLPTQFPLPERNGEPPVRVISRQEWLSMLLSLLLVFVLIRSAAIALLSKRLGVTNWRLVRLQLLSALFVSSLLGLFMVKTIYQSSDFLPVLVALFGAAVVYFVGATDLPATTAKPPWSTKQRVALGQLYTVSRLAIIRVNILAALVMLFARSDDRWAIGITANVLAWAALSIMEIIRRSPG